MDIALVVFQTVSIGTQVIVRYRNLSAFSNGNGDLISVYGHDIEYDGIFSVEELKLFEIKFVFHVVPPQSTNLYQTEYSTSISRVS